MRLLADESCDFSVVRGLRSAGYDVTSIAESLSGAPDEQVIDLARSERRLLITEDKDFGQLVFSAASQNSGVLLVRYPALARFWIGRCNAGAPVRAWRNTIQVLCCCGTRAHSP